ncbi:uncharacterized protein LY79DRAFT_586441 [Colletotrichum navitas]|uniref:Protein kinase domain-containing protein n=1 Tax=Colletotrichum navitas TaxID=681940 RepID=A0AAD8VBF5_9PEZI|nr:uncharacterized protein LY79DRAFT_586441 [Colletotrichum navitas]KAK1598926.1 hypothetical protein LY79DRAFT_586441 [Colletotrichum navitas]
MENPKRYDVALWQVHETENDCELVIRTNNGYAFYCRIFPHHLRQSPKTTKQYFKCLKLLRSGEEEQDDFYVEDACDWLSHLFQPLIAQLALSSPALPEESPTLDQYLFPQHFVCDLEVIDEVSRPYLAEDQDHGWSRPVLVVKDEFIKDLDQWTRSYHPSDVQLVYKHPKDVLIKRPKKVLVDASKGSETTCFFKPFGLSLGSVHAKKELLTLREVTQLPRAPEAWVCRLHGVVREGNVLMGMLFTWIDATGVLGRARAENSSSDIRKRWAAQIRTSLEKLHDRGIIWGDAKADNVLIDRDNNAWVIDFGGSYTPGWIDKEKAGTLEGDAQGLAKILDILR